MEIQHLFTLVELFSTLYYHTKLSDNNSIVYIYKILYLHSLSIKINCSSYNVYGIKSVKLSVIECV